MKTFLCLFVLALLFSAACGETATPGDVDTSGNEHAGEGDTATQPGPEFANPIFMNLHVERKRGTLLCMAEGDAYELNFAPLSATSRETMRVEGRRVQNASATDPDCFEYAQANVPNPGTCLAAKPIAGRTLDPTELEHLTKLLRDLPAQRCVPKQGLFCDGCGPRKITLDGQVAQRDCCGTMNPAYPAAFDAVLDYVDSLIAI